MSKHCQDNVICVGNTVYVDSVCGNDKTGKIFSLNFPFATINAAIRALRKISFTSTVEVIVRPGEYQEGVIYLIDNISLQGSGRLATQIFGQINTINVKQESTVLELSINSNNTPAILGFSKGKVSFRRIRASSTYLNSFNQSSVLVTNGNHIFSDSEVSLNNNGGNDSTVYRHLGGYLEVERSTNSINSIQLPIVEVNPNLPEFVPNRGLVQYNLRGINQTIILPYEEVSVSQTSIVRPFILAQQAGSSVIQNLEQNTNLQAGQAVEVDISTTLQERIYVLNPSSPVQSLENSNIYKIDNANNFSINNNSTLPSNNLINQINLSGKGTLHLPEDIGFGYTLINNGTYKIKSKKEMMLLPDDYIPGDKIENCQSKKIKIKAGHNYTLLDYPDFIGVQVDDLNSNLVEKRIRQQNNRSSINSSLTTFDTSNTEAVAATNPNFPAFSGNPVSGDVNVTQAGVNYIVADNSSATFFPDFNIPFTVTVPDNVPTSSRVQVGFNSRNNRSIFKSLDSGTYIVRNAPPPPIPVPPIPFITISYVVTKLNPEVDNVGEVHTLEIPAPEQIQPASTDFPAFDGNPVSGEFNVVQTNVNYIVATDNSAVLTPAFDSNGNPSLTGPFTITIPAGTAPGALYGVYLTPQSQGDLKILFSGNTYLITPGSTSYNITTVVPGGGGGTNVTNLSASGTFQVTAFSNFNLPTTNDSRLFIFNVTSNGVGSVVNALGSQTITGDGQILTNRFIFNRAGTYRFNNFLAPGDYIVTYFPANHKLTQISGAVGVTLNNNSNFIPVVQNSGFASAIVKYNNATVENGSQMETLIESNDANAKVHINNAGIMRRKDLPAFVIPPGAEDNNYNIQQIGTERDHYRGGNQIERTTAPIISGATYEVQENDHTIILGGNNTIILPFIIPLDGHSNPNIIEVPNGTRFILINESSSTGPGPSTITARGLAFTCGGISTGSITLAVNETIYLTAVATSVNINSPPNPNFSTYYHVSRTSCLP